MYFILLPLNIEVTEVPKYTVLLGRFHIHALGTSIGLILESWSANTCMVISFFVREPPDQEINVFERWQGEKLGR